MIIIKVSKEKLPNKKPVFYVHTLFRKVQISGKEYSMLNNIIAKCKHSIIGGLENRNHQ